MTGLQISSSKSKLVNADREHYESVKTNGERVKEADSNKYLSLSSKNKSREHLKLIDDKITGFTRVSGLLKLENRELRLERRFSTESVPQIHCTVCHHWLSTRFALRSKPTQQKSAFQTLVRLPDKGVRKRLAADLNHDTKTGLIFIREDGQRSR